MSRASIIFTRTLSLCLCAWWFSGNAVAENAEPDAIRYHVRRWLTDEGLPHNNVNAIAQTSDGYLWVGTREGLARFDGVRFTPVEVPSLPFLRQAGIATLLVTRDGTLWIGTEKDGLVRLRDGVFTRFQLAVNQTNAHVQCLLETRTGRLWAGGDTGLFIFEEGRFQPFGEGDKLRNNSVKALHEDADGILRVATVTGLVSVNPAGTADTNNFAIGPLNGILKAVTSDNQGRLWIGATDGLLSLADGRRGSYAANKAFPEKITTALCNDSLGQLWIGTYAGLFRRVNGALSPWWVNKHSASDIINVVFEDHERNLWIGSNDGLLRLSPARFTSWTMEDGLNCNNVTAVREDRSGTMWFATWGGGVNRLSNNVVSIINTTNGLTHDTVLSLCETRDHQMLIGMDFVGVLNRLLPGNVNTFPRERGLLNAAVRVIHEDRQGALWIGTSSGLNIMRGGEIKTVTTTNGLPAPRVMAICERLDGSVWIGTEGGLAIHRNGTFTNFTTRDGLSHNSINALYEDKDGVLWIGTRGGGLNRLRYGTNTAYTTAQGLFSDELYEIVEDDSGFFWMSCRRGIFRVDKRAFDELDRGNIRSLRCVDFARADGLPTAQCNGVSKPAGWKSRDGRIWFPTIRGVVALDPGIEINTNEPPVRIEEVYSGKQLLWTGGFGTPEKSRIKIPPGAGDVRIQFTALTFQSPDKVRFKYRIAELENEWTEAGNNRSVTYPALTHGRYRFEVIASNNDGLWNAKGTALDIEVQPHYWQALWFKFAIAAIVVSVFILFYRGRVRHLREIERLRIRIASDLHDDVGSRLTRVQMVTELADRDLAPSDKGKTYVRNISSTVREITRAMDEIVWTINPRNDTLDNLANYIFQHAQEYFQNTEIRCRLTVPIELPDHAVTTEQRHNVFMAVKEALNNVLKHSAATEVRVAIAVSDETLVIVITDNGRGFIVEDARTAGNGLLNMSERLRQIGGSTRLESKPGLGTTVTFEITGRWKK